MGNTQVGGLIRQVVKQKNLSLRQLGKEIGMDVSTLSRIVNNKQQPNIKHLEKISSALHIPLEELLRAAGHPVNPITQVGHKIPDKGSLEDQDIFEICSQLEGEEFTTHIERELDKYGQYMSVPEGKAMVMEQFESKLDSVGQIGPIVDLLKELYQLFCQADLARTLLILIGSGLLYFIIAPDIIPDFVFPLGFIDDTIAIKIITNKIAKYY
ncbi:MAG: helix-turn-helix domain-containing protein [Cellulosilyticaceae bacterium]